MDFAESKTLLVSGLWLLLKERLGKILVNTSIMNEKSTSGPDSLVWRVEFS